MRCPSRIVWLAIAWKSMWGRSSCAYVCEGAGPMLRHARFRFSDASNDSFAGSHGSFRHL